MAHKYGEISGTITWEAIMEDVPVLRDYCNSILQKYRILEQPAVEVGDEDNEKLK